MSKHHIACLLGGAALLAALSLTVWKMLAFHGQLRAITDNAQWERQLEVRGVFHDVRPILFFGDSEIAFWPMAESFGSMPIRNRGIAGDQLHVAMDRYEQALRTLNPRLVVLLIGTNDLGHHREMDEYLAEVDRVLTQAPQAAVVGSLLPVRGEFLANHPIAELQRWNAHLRALAERHGAPFVDFYALLADDSGLIRPQFTNDGLHPSARGYAVMTAALRGYLTTSPMLAREVPRR